MPTTFEQETGNADVSISSNAQPDDPDLEDDPRHYERVNFKRAPNPREFSIRQSTPSTVAPLTVRSAISAAGKLQPLPRNAHTRLAPKIFGWRGVKVF